MIMAELRPFLADLPADHYGVHVENDMDARRLLYLVEKIGREKVTRSASKYSEKYPGSRVFVSDLLKRYGVKVPTRVYAPVNVPLYRVYMLLHSGSSIIKIGYSGDWIQRALAFKCEFDLDRSVGFAFHDKVLAIAAEKSVKRLFDWVTLTQGALMGRLNPVLRGWAQYHSPVVAKATFSKLDNLIFWRVFRSAKRRHPRKSVGWIRGRYYCSEIQRAFVQPLRGLMGR